ncbi:cysteine proteinase [Clavulina sp. PMI_390]|nr:cysteine proteinase [Clavulina sp. PMI_390]
MAKGKRHVQRLPPRSRTRMHKPKLADPDSSVQLAAQLETLGLRLHDTLGDGNCLFRALSDQLYGTEVYHLNLRTEITTWMAKYPERYEGFVEDDRSFEDHLRCMRQPGTYGGHLEISAFAHVKRKNVKVIQPGLVYVIEWDAGAAFPASPSAELAEIRPASPDDEREKRRSKRDKRRTSLDDQHDGEGGAPSIGNTVYIASVVYSRSQFSLI